MALTGNKGEWSEIYTLLKLLGEGKVYAGDQHMNKIHDLFYPIIMILRQEKEGNFNYKLQDIIRKSKFPQNPKRSVRFSGKRTKRSVQKRKARNTQKAETKVL